MSIFKKISVPLFIFSIFILSGCSKQAADSILSPTDNPMTEIPDVLKQNQKLGRGINLGNALEAPKEGEWGVTLKEDYFRVIKEKGFNSVRIPVKWSSHAITAAPYTIDPAFFQRVDWAVNQAISNGLAAIINIHHYDEIMQDPASHKARFLALWSSISVRYKNYPGELFFEVLNEPNNQMTPALWNQYLNEAIQIIRKSNPYRTIVAGPAYWNSIDNLNSLSLPASDRNIIVTYHYYSPMQFTHQGAEWVTGSSQWLGTTWTGTYDQMSAVIRDLDRVLQWANVNSRPMHMGEFGAYSKADMNSRVKWTGFVSRQAETRGFSWAYWEFCSGFGAYDPKKNEWIVPLLNALIPPAS